MIYTILTTLIIVLSKLRDLVCSPEHGGGHLRFDHCIPWSKNYGDNYYMSCCDCGLTHFIVPYHSMTPVRPRFYHYSYRLGAKAWHEPDFRLAKQVEFEARQSGVIE